MLERAHGRDRPVRRPRDRESPLGAEHVAKAGEARPVAVEEAAVPPARPDPATRRLEHDHVERRVTPLQLDRGPETREAAADDRDVGGRVAVERGLLGIGRRLLEPPGVGEPGRYRRCSSFHASASDVAEHLDDAVELGLAGDERRRDLDDRIAAVVGATDEAALEQARGEEAAQQPLALVVRERLARLLVLHELDRVEEAGTADVADDRQVEQLLERRAERRLVLEDALDDPLALHDLDVLERDRAHDGVAAERDAVREHRACRRETAP